jgi:hypothetical protein
MNRIAATLLMLLALPFMWAGSVIAMTIVLVFNTACEVGKIWNTKAAQAQSLAPTPASTTAQA